VSGGFAALFAGFIGFLISEKFGIELVDSGDFYIALMYAVIASCAVRPLIQSYTKRYTLYHPLSYKYLITFYSDLLQLFIQFIKRR
jgi:Na+-translocating ferredoxin:NAD+ oxidoreductase RnfD subunit